jgi:hypothetical protein
MEDNIKIILGYSECTEVVQGYFQVADLRVKVA